MGICAVVWERITPAGGVSSVSLENLKDESFDALSRLFFGRLSLLDHERNAARLVGVFNQKSETLLCDATFKKWIAEQSSLTLDTVVLEALYAQKQSMQQ